MRVQAVVIALLSCMVVAHRWVSGTSPVGMSTSAFDKVRRQTKLVGVASLGSKHGSQAWLPVLNMI